VLTIRSAHLWGMWSTCPPLLALLSFNRDFQPAVGFSRRDGSLSTSTCHNQSGMLLDWQLTHLEFKRLGPPWRIFHTVLNALPQWHPYKSQPRSETQHSKMNGWDKWPCWDKWPQGLETSPHFYMYYCTTINPWGKSQ
jgi:hypothetical protein